MNHCIFVDDIVLFAYSHEQHLNSFRQFVQISSDFNGNINWDKTKIAQEEIDYCGFKVNGSGYSCKDGYIMELKTLASPKSMKDCQTLLGMLGWVRDFILNFTDVVEPIRAVVKLKHFQWTQDAENVLRWCIELLEATQLTYFGDGTFEMYTDASKDAVGCTIYQEDKIIGMFSKRLDRSEKEYSIFQKEMYAIERALVKYGKYMGTNLIRIHCDNEATGWFLKGYGSQLTLKVKNWISEVQQYNIEYDPIAGKDNKQADILSRLPHEINAMRLRKRRIVDDQQETAVNREDVDSDDDSELKRKQPSPSVINIPDDIEEYSGSDDIACICNQNKEYGIMIQCAACDRWSHIECYNMTPDDNLDDSFHCRYCTGVASLMVLRQGQEPMQEGNVPMEEDRNGWLEMAHKYHAGIGAMRILLRGIKWKGKDKDIIAHASNCNYCVKKRIPRQVQLKFRLPKGVNDIVEIDLMEVEEEWDGIVYRFIAVIKDMFSGCVHLKLMTNKTPDQTYGAIVGYCAKFSYPRLLVYDGGNEFMGEFLAFVKQENIAVDPATPGIHKENGIAERAIQHIQGILRVIKKEHPDLAIENQVLMAEMFINNTPRERTMYAPQELMTLQGVNLGNQKEYLSDDIREHVQQQLFRMKTKQQDQRNKGLRTVDFVEGDRVWFYPIIPKKKLRQLGYIATILREQGINSLNCGWMMIRRRHLLGM